MLFDPELFRIPIPVLDAATERPQAAHEDGYEMKSNDVTAYGVAPICYAASGKRDTTMKKYVLTPRLLILAILVAAAAVAVHRGCGGVRLRHGARPAGRDL